MAIASFLPWQQDVASEWLKDKDRFAHAWLIHGLAGIGKRNFALAAAASLLCEAPERGLACGKCLACGWVALGNHPDLKRIRPEALAIEEGINQGDAEDAADGQTDTSAATKRMPSKEIRVEQIRSLETWFNTGTHRAGYRVVLLYPAESLNAISANALLKVLEEPQAQTIFLLVADAPDRLLATLLSRCRRLPLPTPSHDTSTAWLNDQGVQAADEWLAAAGGAPMLARSLAEQQPHAYPEWLSSFLSDLVVKSKLDLGQLADTLAKTPTTIWLGSLQRACVDLVLASHKLPVRYFPALSDIFGKLVVQSSPRALVDLAAWVSDQVRLANHPLNAKLFAHSVLQRVLSACSSAQSK